MGTGLVDPALEERVLQLAVEEGYLTAAELAEQLGAFGERSPRLSAIVHSGLLSGAIVDRLTSTVTEQGSGSNVVAMPPRPDGSKRNDERFQVGELLGEGGMAKVYRAYDNALHRPVALKFLKSDEPERLERFLREAQSQARVDHENVCKIYEVGELEGRPFIAMQLIEGQPLFITEGEVSRLSAMVATMNAEQKARLMQKVAEGIHAAHREGLIHRDIKPSNIILESTPDGDFKPYVLDFGLAREVASAGLTSMGLAAGTPNFMAPEQARGDSAALDRRTDVYGLGATLYALLAGNPPFEAASSLDVLIKVTEQEAPALTGVPADLVTIVGKCLEKEPAQRYDSARALAEDLERYLNGDAIQGRKTSVAYRLLKKVKKHKKATAGIALMAVAFVTLGGWSIASQLRSMARTRLAGVFGQEVKGIESIMQVAHLIPEHDIRAEKVAVRQRMGAIETQISKIGSVADGPGHYALGRGHLALGEPEQARKDLELAWKAGYRDRAVSYALGLTMGSLYQKELDAADRISNKKKREERKQVLQTEYRDPALHYLAQSRGMDNASPEYVEALVAFYEKRYPVALAKARAAYHSVPSLYEARALEGTVYSAIAKEGSETGKNTEGMQAAQWANQAFAAAASIGRSDPEVPIGVSRLMLSVLKMKLYVKGGDVSPQLQVALESANRALRIDPDNADAYLYKANVLWRMAEVEDKLGHDPRPLVGQSVEASEQALRLRPGDPNVYYETGAAIDRSVSYESHRGIDPSASIARVSHYLDAALRINPNELRVYTERGIMFRHLARYRSGKGLDPTDAYRRSEEAFQRRLALQYDDTGLRNLASAYLEKAQQKIRDGDDPRTVLALALTTAEKARAFAPDSQRSNYFVGNVFYWQAKYELEAGLDPTASIGRALGAYQQTLAIDPNSQEGVVGMVELQRLLAQVALNKGVDPTPMIEEGRRWLEKLSAGSLATRPQLEEGELALLQGRWQMSRGGSPAGSFARAITAAQQAVERLPMNTDGYVLLAEIYERMAAWQRSRGRAAGQALSLGMEAAAQALQINPRHAKALAIRDALNRDQIKTVAASKN